MNVALIYGGKNSSSAALEKITKALSRGLEEQSHMVRIINAYVDTDQRLSYFDFIIVGTEPAGLMSSKIPEQIKKYLREIPGSGGKRSIGFVSGGLRPNAALQSLMKAMEAEGMLLTASEIIKKENDAYLIGKHLKLERN